MKIPLIILLSNINNYLNNTFGKCFIQYDPKGVTKPISSSGTKVWAGAIFLIDLLWSFHNHRSQPLAAINRNAGLKFI